MACKKNAAGYFLYAGLAGGIRLRKPGFCGLNIPTYAKIVAQKGIQGANVAAAGLTNPSREIVIPATTFEMLFSSFAWNVPYLRPIQRRTVAVYARYCSPNLAAR
jgi:hypothetical protein